MQELPDRVEATPVYDEGEYEYIYLHIYISNLEVTFE